MTPERFNTPLDGFRHLPHDLGNDLLEGVKAGQLDEKAVDMTIRGVRMRAIEKLWTGKELIGMQGHESPRDEGIMDELPEHVQAAIRGLFEANREIADVLMMALNGEISLAPPKE